MITISKTVAAIALALPIALTSYGTPAAQEEGECISGLQIQQAITAGRIMDLADALSEAGIKGMPLSEPEVCRIDGALKYRVNVKSGSDYDREVLNAQRN